MSGSMVRPSARLKKDTKDAVVHYVASIKDLYTQESWILSAAFQII